MKAGRLALRVVGVLATLGAALRPATADVVSDLVDRYRATTGRRDDRAYADQEAALTALADLRTPAAQRAVRGLLDAGRHGGPGGTSDRRRLVLLLAAFVRHGAPEDLDAVLRIVEQERDPALVAALPRVVAGIRAPTTLEHLRGAAFRRAVPALKARLARALGASGDREAALALVTALADPDFDVRAEALFALGELRDEAAYPTLAVFLSGEDARLREVAARALGVLGAARAAPALARALDDPAPRVVESAATSLGVLGSPAAVAPPDRTPRESPRHRPAHRGGPRARPRPPHREERPRDRPRAVARVVGRTQGRPAADGRARSPHHGRRTAVLRLPRPHEPRGLRARRVPQHGLERPPRGRAGRAEAGPRPPPRGDALQPRHLQRHGGGVERRPRPRHGGERAPCRALRRATAARERDEPLGRAPRGDAGRGRGHGVLPLRRFADGGGDPRPRDDPRGARGDESLAPRALPHRRAPARRTPADVRGVEDPAGAAASFMAQLARENDGTFRKVE